MPLSDAHCKDEQLLLLVMDSAMLDSGFPSWARCIWQKRDDVISLQHHG
jgi:hypothetical protein